MNVIKIKKQSFVLILFITLLALSIGYAIVTTNFNIGGTVSTQSPSDDINDTSNLKQNFIVNWNDTVKEIDYSNAYGAEANVAIDKNTKTVTIGIENIAKLNSSITVKLQIDNDSIDLIADIDIPEIINSQYKYFDIYIDWIDSVSINPKGYIEIYVTIVMIKSPLEQIAGDFTITFTAEAREV